MKILYLGNEVRKITSGYESLNSRNIFLLKSLENSIMKIVEFEEPSLTDKFSLYIGGTSKKYMRKVMKAVSEEEFDFIFSCSSMLGPVMRNIKNKFPNIPIICNFHNIERQYAAEYLRVGGITKILFYLAAIRAESEAVKSMDYSLVLSNKDSEILNQYYNKRADAIIPICYNDCCANLDFESIRKGSNLKANNTRIDLLFIGTAFFANVEGINWFIRNILPNIDAKLTIVGRDMDKAVLHASDKVVVKGFVEDLASEYLNADVVIAPILSGAGMKTKIAEALMYGKTIVGTSVAFEGYIRDEKSMKVADSVDQFISFLSNPINFSGKFNPISRNIFLKEYSVIAAQNRLYNLMLQWYNNK